MKFNLTMVILMSALLYCNFLVAECTTNRNSDILITKPDSLYIDYGDGIVSDNETGLVWQQCSLGLTGNLCNVGVALELTWQAALVTANVNADNGYNDWRLPNKNELESLLEDACYDPAINETMFPNTQSSFYWSSSPYAGYGFIVWLVNFNNGLVYWGGKRGVARYVRLVRGSN